MENIWGKYVGGNFGGNPILDIIEPPDFQKLSIYWVLEVLCICICLCVFVVVFDLDLLFHITHFPQTLWGKNILEENATLQGQGHTGMGRASVC